MRTDEPFQIYAMLKYNFSSRQISDLDRLAARHDDTLELPRTRPFGRESVVGRIVNSLGNVGLGRSDSTLVLTTTEKARVSPSSG